MVYRKIYFNKKNVTKVTFVRTKPQKYNSKEYEKE